MSDPRAALNELIRKSGDDYSSLSRLLGRNAAYIQQFINALAAHALRRRSGASDRLPHTRG